MTEKPTGKNTIEDMIESTAAALQTFATELQAKAKVAGKDAEAAWQKAQPQVKQVQDALEQGLSSIRNKLDEDDLREKMGAAGESFNEAAATALDEMQGALGRLRDKLSKK